MEWEQALIHNGISTCRPEDLFTHRPSTCQPVDLYANKVTSDVGIRGVSPILYLNPGVSGNAVCFAPKYCYLPLAQEEKIDLYDYWPSRHGMSLAVARFRRKATTETKKQI